jgi:hypothetical protein
MSDFGIQDTTPPPPDSAPSDPKPSGLFTKKPTRVKQDSTPTGQTVGKRNAASKNAKRTEKLHTLFSTIGGGIALVDMYDAQVIMTNAMPLAQALADVADVNPAIAKAIDGLSTGGTYGALILAVVSIAMPILAHHKVLPEFVASVFVPSDPNGQ